MAKAKTRKLKVFRTPIGFHDAYVAAPSKKAALEAWGSESNLFAAGAAEEVTASALMEVPLTRPGEVIKVLRGSKAEQVAALGEVAAKPRTKKGSKAGSAQPKPPKPSRADVDEAEERLEKLARVQAKELAAIDQELAEVQRRRREIERRHQRELGASEDRAKGERTRYEREMKAWRSKK